MDWNAFFEWIGKATAFTTPVVLAALWFGRTYIDKWLTNRFQGQLDALKHVQAQEIERLRAKIAGMLDRATKLHHHEFEVLPMVWDKLTTMMGSASVAVANFKSYADVGGMSAEELELILDQTKFAEYEKAELRQLHRHERETRFISLTDRDRLRTAFKDRADYHNAIIKHAIFIEPSILEKMKELSHLIVDALHTQADFGDPDMERPKARERGANADKVHEKGQAKMGEIERMISGRLWNASKLEA